VGPRGSAKQLPPKMSTTVGQHPVEMSELQPQPQPQPQPQQRRQRRLLSQLQRQRPASAADSATTPPFLAAATAAAQEMGLAVTPPDLVARVNLAARLVAPRKMGVVQGEMPLLEMCPPGSVLIRARYASICGSDLPYFRAGGPIGQVRSRGRVSALRVCHPL
jgi:hypothetical protein